MGSFQVIRATFDRLRGSRYAFCAMHRKIREPRRLQIIFPTCGTIVPERIRHDDAT